MIYSVAMKAGLTETEAQDVVQETVITVAKRVEGLKYDPAQGSFKGWLLHITRWRIMDQFRKREPGDAGRNASAPTRRRGRRRSSGWPTRRDLTWKREWDNEWKENVMAAAVARVKRKVDGKQYQIFDCYVMKEWPVKKVAKELGVSVAQVYLAKHRVTALLKKELRNVEMPGKMTND